MAGTKPGTTTEQSGEPSGNGAGAGSSTDEGKGADKATDWRAGLKEQHREPAAEFKTPSDLFEAYQGAVQNKGIKLPGTDATDEDRAAYRTAIGVPDNPDGYQLERPTLPEGMSYDEATEAAYRQWAHAANLSPAQATGIYNSWNETQAETFKQQLAARTQQAADTRQALVTELGGQDKYDAAVTRAHRAVTAFGLGKLITEKGLQSDPEVVKAAIQLGTLISDAAIDQSSGGVRTDAEDTTLPAKRRLEIKV